MGAQDTFFVMAYGVATAILLHGQMPFWKVCLLGLSVVTIAFLIKYS